MPMPIQERMLTVKQLTQSDEFSWFFTSVGKVYRAVHEHGLRCARPTGTMMFAPTTVREWMSKEKRAKFAGRLVAVEGGAA